VPHVDYALRTLHQSVLPHVAQGTAVMDTASAEQRARVTMEDLLGPLDMLFEYGELQSSAPTDPALRPLCLVGQDTLLLGSCPRSGLPASWAQSRVGARSMHYVVEACEPSSGIRWCRTHFLQRGRRLPSIRDASALVQSADEDDETTASDEGEAASAKLAMTDAVMQRLEGMSAKLMFCLRWAVRTAFSEFTDVLDAGQYVQQTLDAILKGKTDMFSNGTASASTGTGCSFPPGLGLEGMLLTADEYLQVHMDCMNGHGKVVPIDDIDDMGGTCWTYIRVSVHRISTGWDTMGVVAVGDTFLFSGTNEADKPRSNKGSGPSTSTVLSRHRLAADAYCITHLVPYTRYFTAVGVEDRTSKKLLSWLKSPDMVATIGLGRLLQSTLGLVGQISHVPVLTDHPLLPYSSATVRGFSGGFVVEKLDTACLPLLFSLETHAECMWTADLADCLAQAKAHLGLPSGDEESALDTAAGTMIIFKLKSFSSSALASREAARQLLQDSEDAAVRLTLADRKAKFDAGFSDTLEVHADDQDTLGGISSVFNLGINTGLPEAAAAAIDPHSAAARNEIRRQDEQAKRATRAALQFNPLQRSLPALPLQEPRYVAICAHTDARNNAALSKALSHWRVSARQAGVPEYKGSSSQEPLPPQILTSFISYLDNQHSSAWSRDEEAAASAELLMPAAAALAQVQAARSTLGLAPGSAFGPMRCLHALNETARIMAAKPHLGDAEEEDEGKGEDFAPSEASFDEDEGAVDQPNPLRLVVLLGHPGACPTHFGAQIAERAGKLLLVDERDSDPETEATAACLCVPMIVDITPLGSGRKGSETASVEAIVNAAWAACRKNSHVSLLETHALVVSVVTNPHMHVHVPELLALLAYVCSRNYSTVGSDSRSVINRGCVVASVVSALCPASVLPVAKLAAADENTQVNCSLGTETWAASGLHGAHAGQLADLVISIDGSSSGSAFSRLRQWLAAFNADAVAVRVTPSNLRLEADAIDLLLSRLRAAVVVAASVVSACKPLCAAKGYGTPLPTAPAEREWNVTSKLRRSHAYVASVPVLQTMRVLPPNKGKDDVGGAWSINSLVSVLKILFPRAVLSNNVAGDTWKVPRITDDPFFHGLAGLRLAAALAKVKVMTRRQCEEERKSFSKQLQELLHTERADVDARDTNAAVAVLAAGLHAKSVHGVVSVPVGNPIDDDCSSSSRTSSGSSSSGGLAIVEACAGSIVVRYVDSATHLSLLTSLAAGGSGSGSVSNSLSVYGVFDNGQSALAEQLFALCGRYRLQAQPELQRSGVAKHELFTLQRHMEASAVPLPSGWWWNGSSYVDHVGTALLLRPDIEPHAEAFVAHRNKQIGEYNVMLASLQRFL